MKCLKFIEVLQIFNPISGSLISLDCENKYQHIFGGLKVPLRVGKRENMYILKRLR